VALKPAAALNWPSSSGTPSGSESERISLRMRSLYSTALALLRGGGEGGSETGRVRAGRVGRQ
jgi:hypothetical protein